MPCDSVRIEISMIHNNVCGAWAIMIVSDNSLVAICQIFQSASVVILNVYIHLCVLYLL